jgi:hypothetical protein
MRGRRCLKLFLPLMLFLAALGASSAVTASPASAGAGIGAVTDRFDNPLGGILIEALDMETGDVLATATTSPATGDFVFDLTPPASGMYKVRASDPAGVFATSYLYGHTTFETADLIGYT